MTLPLRAKRCRTCPWREGGLEVSDDVRAKMLEVTLGGGSHVCHHHQVEGREPEFRCRGTFETVQEIRKQAGLGRQDERGTTPSTQAEAIPRTFHATVRLA